MKRIISITILILTFCLAVIAQTDKDECGKINIKHPLIVYTQPSTETTFEVSISYEKDDFPDTVRFNWTIINDDEVIKIENKKFVKITLKDSEDGGTIIVLAESLNGKCQNTTVARIYYTRPVGSPLIFDLYGELPWNDEKARLDNAAFQMIEMEDQELLISVDYDIKLEQGLKNYLFKVLNHLSTRKLKNDRITFLVASSKKRVTKLQPFPQNPKNFSLEDFSEEYLIIKGEDLEKLAKMFK